MSGVAKGSSCGEHGNSEDVNNTDYATQQNKLRLVLLYSALLTPHGWSMAAPAAGPSQYCLQERKHTGGTVLPVKRGVSCDLQE